MAWNQISWPFPLRIIGPAWGVFCIARKMSPELLSGSRVVVITGGRRFGSEGKCCVLPVAGVPPLASERLLLATGELCRAPTRNEKLSRVAPGAPEAVPALGVLSPALTRSVSPGA